MTKHILLFAAAVLICIPLGVPAAGLAFAAACIFASFPKPPVCRWYGLIIGALAVDIIVIITAESPVVFWGLLFVAAALMALVSLPRAAILFVAAWLMLRLEVPATIYVGAFAGIIASMILLFTYKKNCAIIVGNDIERNTEHG